MEPMFVTLSWDLLILLFTALVVAYGFIVGKDESIKIIVGAYISVVAVQALGNIAQLLLATPTSASAVVGLTLPVEALAIGKLILFAVAVVFLAVRGGIEVEGGDGMGSTWDIVMNGILGLSTAGLLLSSLVTFVSGRPILDLALSDAEPVHSVLPQSPLVDLIVTYQHVWFALPAILLLVLGFLSHRESE